MGRILEYVVLLSSLSLVLGAHQFLKLPLASKYEREKQENFTHIAKQYISKDQNGFSNRRLLPADLQGRKKSPPVKQMLSSVGLHAYSSDNVDRKAVKKTLSERNSKFSELPKRNPPPPFSQSLYPRRNSKNFYKLDLSSQQLSRINDRNNSLNYQTKGTDAFNRRYQKEGRNPRYQPRYSPKICDPCNSVPWVPLLKVSDSYRQQRTHITELHPTPHQNFNFDYHAYASNIHNVLLPPVPLATPSFDGTVSSSFGLPIGNIPTSHGLLAPINHLSTEFNKYAINTIDYSNSFNYYSPQGLLENNNFPELSPVPIVPIHDSGQFYQFGSAIPEMVLPPKKDTSNVVLTISEEQNPTQRLPLNHKNPDAGLSSDSSASHSRTKEQNHSKDFGKLEIIKSIPLAEFTSSVHLPQQQLPFYPPLQSEFSSEHDFHSKKTNSDLSTSDLSFLVPPPKKVQNEVSFNSSKSNDKSEYQEHASVPKPLTSPSLSWLFSDHTAPPSDSKSTASVSSPVTDAQEIASVVNDELRPVSSHSFTEPSSSEQNVAVSKSKKIQIIIPYTTKGNSGHDNNALESVQHEVFQPPVIQLTKESNSSHDFATSVLPPSTEQPHQLEGSRSRKVIDKTETQQKAKNEREKSDYGYLSEMQHIIATNLRELLREEVEKAQKSQNYPLQNNIDNWTALEYSNHKTIATKAPKEIIAQALAVTSIPGTSISHLLLPSKKIPNEYFATTPTSIYDEPSTAHYKTENFSVDSRPFTARPYATTNVYNPMRATKENVMKQLPSTQINHERNYTDVERVKINAWGRLNENLVLPEARSRTRTAEQTTTSTWPSSLYPSSVGTEKIQIVTPISLGPQINHTMVPFRRTTRYAHTTETPTAVKPLRKELSLNKFNSTKLERVSNLTSLFIGKSANNSIAGRNENSSHSDSGIKVTNSVVSVEESGIETTETSGQELSRLSGKGEHFSINDIFPFRNKELPWESGQNGSQPALSISRQRNSLIKQVNLQRPKAVVGSS